MSGIIGKSKSRGSGVIGSDGIVKSVSGSTGVVADSDIDHDSLANFAANEHFTQANITATGTVSSGTWEGTAVAANKGGTGQTSYTVGDVLYASGSTALSKLAATTDGYLLTATGAGSAPAWEASVSLPLSGGTMTGNITAADNVIIRPEIKDYSETVNAAGNTGAGAEAIDITAGNIVTSTVTAGTVTYSFSNPSPDTKCCSFTLILTNGGSQTVNWPGAVDWAGGTAPTLPASGIDILVFMSIDAGTKWYGFAGAIDTK